MELRHLRYFVAVAETLSFRIAAENLNLSGPALSKQIKDLENEMEVRLLDRDTTQVRLTNAGKVFLAEARTLLTHAGKAVEMAREAAAGHRGHLTIGNIGSILANYLAESLANFCARFPEVDVDLIDLDLFEQIDALKTHRIQVGFVLANDRQKMPADFQRAPVLQSGLGFVMVGNHRLVGQRRISLVDAAGEKLLAIKGRRGSFHAGFMTAMFNTRGLKPGKVTLVNGFESLVAMIAAGQGISVLALRGSIGRTDNVVIRPIRETGPDLSIELCAIWRDPGKSSPAANYVEELRRLTQPTKPRTGKSVKMLVRP